MGDFGASLVFTGSLSLLRERNHGVCYGFCAMKMIYRGCAQEILMKPYTTMSRLEAMKDRNGTRKVLEKLCTIAASLTLAVQALLVLGIIDVKAPQTSKFILIML
jgi:hypothetical protein